MGEGDRCSDQSRQQDLARPESRGNREARRATQEREGRSLSIAHQRFIQVREQRLIVFGPATEPNVVPRWEAGRKRGRGNSYARRS